MHKILVVDDDKDIVSALQIYLEAEDFEVHTAYNGKVALELAKKVEFQLILLDIMMPVMDGIMTLKELRKFSNVPVIFLTAKSEEVDMIMGLNIGADDYVTKPFRMIELIARVKAQIRRYVKLGGSALEEENSRIITLGGLVLDEDRKVLTVEGEAVSITPTEYAMISLFMKNPGKVFSPAQIYKSIWNEECVGSERSIPVHIRHLREKVEINPANPRYLKVVWGQGYRMEGGN